MMIDLFVASHLTRNERALKRAAQDFQAEAAALGHSLAARDAPQWVRERLDVVASDVINSVAVLIEDHRRARSASVSSAKRRLDDPVERLLGDPRNWGDAEALTKAVESALGPPGEYLARKGAELSGTARVARRLGVAYKGFFIFVRAFQDAIYCMIDGKGKGSMSKAAGNERNAVRAVLDVELPEYIPWFVPFRDRRDKIKYGQVVTVTNTGTEPRSHDLGLMFGIRAGKPLVFHLTEATQAIEMSTAATRVAERNLGL